MKKFVISSLLTSGLFVCQASPTLASGVNYYRNLESNNILKCASPRQIEILWTGGNTTSYGSAHTILCLKNSRQAEWIMESSVTCQSQKIPLEKCPLWFDNQQFEAIAKTKNNTLTVSPRKTAIGINCTIKTRPAKYSEDLDYYWTCEKYQARKNLTIKTTGQKFSVNNHDGDEHQFWLHSYENPDCKKDSTSTVCFKPYPDLGNDGNKYRPEMSIDCRGDAQFCKYYYQPYQY
jgi:hypothetical protein